MLSQSKHCQRDMSPRITIYCPAVAILIAYAAASMVAAAEPSLRLVEIPEHLVLPLPEGTNQVLTAKVAGGKAKSVWLAVGESATEKVPLVPVGKGEYQVNLADPEIADVVRDAADRRQFRVFAELADGTVIESTGVNFTLRPPEPPKARCYVYMRARPKDGVQVESGELWLAADEVTMVELRIEADLMPSGVRAEVAERVWPLEPANKDGLFQLQISDKIRAAWQEEGELRIAYQVKPEWVTAAVLKARPASLELAAAVPFTVFQRTSEAIPGSRGYLRVYAGDITAGQVILELRAEDGANLIDKVSVRQGDSPEFELNGERYSLHVKRLANVLVGDDWAELEVHSSSAEPLSRIERLLDRIAEADVKFVREGQQYTGREAADHLRRKLAAAGSRIENVEDFIEKIASRSSTTGKPYHIKLADGTMVEAQQWLEEQLKRMAEEPQPNAETPADSPKQERQSTDEPATAPQSDKPAGR